MVFSRRLVLVKFCLGIICRQVIISLCRKVEPYDIGILILLRITEMSVFCCVSGDYKASQ